MTPLLDTHQHLIYPDIAGYSWTGDINVLANRKFTIEDYQDLTDTRQVTGSIFMEAGVDEGEYQQEARFVAGLVDDPANNLIAMIPSCRPEFEDGFDAWLEECSDMPVAGCRRMLHVVDDDMSQDELFRKNVRKMGNRDLTFDMCFLARQLPIAVEFAKACDNTTLVLNHCGVPDIAGGDFESWRQNISDLAAIPNVACKVSGIMAYCKPGTASFETVRPYLEHVAQTFGSNRLVWGSDWPVVQTANGIEDWIDVTREFLSTLSAEETKKISYQNASKIYGLPI